MHWARKTGRQEKVLPALMPDADETAAGARTAIHANSFFAPELDQLGPFDLVIGNQAFEGLRQGRLRVSVFQRHGPLLGSDRGGGAAVEPGEFLLEKRGVAERGGH